MKAFFYLAFLTLISGVVCQTSDNSIQSDSTANGYSNQVNQIFNQCMASYPPIMQSMMNSPPFDYLRSYTRLLIRNFLQLPTCDSNGLVEYQPALIPNPGQDITNAIAGQLTLTICDSNRPGVNQSETEYGFLFGFDTSTSYCNGAPPGYYRAWAITLRYVGDDGIYNDYCNRHGSWPQATTLHTRRGNQGPIPAAAWARRGQYMGFDRLPAKRGQKMIVFHENAGYGVTDQTYWRRGEYHSNRTIVYVSNIAPVEDNMLPNDGQFLRYPLGMYNHAEDRKVTFAVLNQIKANGLRMYVPALGQQVDIFTPGQLDTSRSAFGSHSDGGPANVGSASQNGAPRYNITHDPALDGQLLLNSEATLNYQNKRVLRGVNMMEFSYTAQGSYGSDGQIRGQYLNQCSRLSWLNQVHLATHRSFLTDAQIMALVANDTNNIQFSSPFWCIPYDPANPTVFAPACISLNTSAGPGYPENTLKHMKFWDSIAINVLLAPERSPCWIPYMNTAIMRALMQGTAKVIHGTPGTEKWKDPQTPIELAEEYRPEVSDSSTPLDSQIALIQASYSLSASSLGPSSSADPNYQSGSVNMKIQHPIVSLPGDITDNPYPLDGTFPKC